MNNLKTELLHLAEILESDDNWSTGFEADEVGFILRDLADGLTAADIAYTIGLAAPDTTNDVDPESLVHHNQD